MNFPRIVLLTSIVMLITALRQYCENFDKYLKAGLVLNDKYMSRDKIPMFEYTITKNDCRLNR